MTDTNVHYLTAGIEAYFQDRSEKPARPLKTDGGDGTSGDMESRVTRLETHMEYVRRDLDDIRGTNQRILDKLDRLNDLPTKSDLASWRWQWIAIAIAIIAFTVGGITGGLALIAKFAG